MHYLWSNTCFISHLARSYHHLFPIAPFDEVPALSSQNDPRRKLEKSFFQVRIQVDNVRPNEFTTWNSMITSLGVHGCGEEEALLCLNRWKKKKNWMQTDFEGLLNRFFVTR